MKPTQQPPPPSGGQNDEGFLRRWSRLKKEQRQPPPAAPAQAEAAATQAAEAKAKAPPPPTDADMPPIETLQNDSDISPFMSSGVSESLRRRALRKIFSGGRFNVRDGLDDYDEDFTNFAPLGDVLTAEYRRWKKRYDEMTERRQQEEADKAPQAPPAQEAQEAPPQKAEEAEAPQEPQEEGEGKNPAPQQSHAV